MGGLSLFAVDIAGVLVTAEGARAAEPGPKGALEAPKLKRQVAVGWPCGEGIGCSHDGPVERLAYGIEHWAREEVVCLGPEPKFRWAAAELAQAVLVKRTGLGVSSSAGLVDSVPAGSLPAD